MCAEVKFDDGQTFPAWEAETCAELSRRMGGPLVRDKGYAESVDITGANCLCCVDLQATADKYGYRCQADDGGFDITFSN